MIRLLTLAIACSVGLAGAAVADSSSTTARAASSVVGAQISREATRMTVDQINQAAQTATKEAAESGEVAADAAESTTADAH